MTFYEMEDNWWQTDNGRRIQRVGQFMPLIGCKTIWSAFHIKLLELHSISIIIRTSCRTCTSLCNIKLGCATAWHVTIVTCLQSGLHTFAPNAPELTPGKNSQDSDPLFGRQQAFLGSVWTRLPLPPHRDDRSLTHNSSYLQCHVKRRMRRRRRRRMRSKRNERRLCSRCRHKIKPPFCRLKSDWFLSNSIPFMCDSVYYFSVSHFSAIYYLKRLHPRVVALRSLSLSLSLSTSTSSPQSSSLSLLPLVLVLSLS